MRRKTKKREGKVEFRDEDEDEDLDRKSAHRTDTRSWRPTLVTAALVGLGPAAGPMVGHSPAAIALRGCSAAYALSSPACFAGPCASRVAVAVPGSPVIRSWPWMCKRDGTRRRSTRRPSSWKRARREWKMSFRRKRWGISCVFKPFVSFVLQENKRDEGWEKD